MYLHYIPLCCFCWQSIIQLERELSYLGGMCAASLIKKDVALPPGKLSSDENTLKFIV